MPSSAPRVKDIFNRALELESPAERIAYLDKACEGAPDIRQQVEALLQAYAEAGSFLEPDVKAGGIPNATGTFAAEPFTKSYDPDGTVTQGPLPGGLGSSPALTLGTVIAGRYALVEVIGEGGMGSVYLASQTEPVKRQVALKLIKKGMDSKTVLARFDAERQALALMDHPNIARIYDGGVTPSGQPFFVMELVNGVPLTEYCDTKRLTVDARLQLFVQVCQAVQHAHQKGIIHRDLKPGNVLVTEVDGRPTPKVIDFGVAKATEQKLTDQSLSDTGAIVGTPAYMSPEQADPSSIDIDTRSDVYALGVMLYELLAGSPPIDSRQFKRGAILEMLRMVREVEPPRPSTKLSTADALPNIAANRSIDPGKLSKLLQGELDWVVMKALEKDRTRRYDTANGLARDIQRYLADEVVEARPPSRGYRLKKFVKRNKVQVIAASLVFLSLVGGVVGTTIGLLRAEERRKEAEQARTNEAERAEGERVAKDKAERKHHEAETNLAFARKGNDILGSVFIGLDPKANYATIADFRNALRDNLSKAVKELDGSAIGDPLEVAAMQITLGRSLVGVGEARMAITVLRKATETRQTRLGPDHKDTLVSMNDLAGAYYVTGELDQALLLRAKTLELMEAKLGRNDPETVICLNNLGVAYHEAGKLDKALPAYEEAARRTEANHGPDHPQTLTALNNLAEGYREAGMLDKALSLFRKNLALRNIKLGPNDPETLGSMNNLGLTYLLAGELELALPLLEETVKRKKATLGADNPSTLISMGNLAEGYNDAGRPEKALPLIEETLRFQKVKPGPKHLDTLYTMNNLAASYQANRKLGQAIPLFEEALELLKSTVGPDHHLTCVTSENLVLAYAEAKQGEKAAKTLRTIIAETGKRVAADPHFAGKLAKAAHYLLDCGQYPAAEELLRECVAIYEKLQPDAWPTFNARSMLGGALLGQKKYADAEPLLLKGYEGMKAREKTIPPASSTRIPEALDRLIELYTAMKKPEEVKKWREERAKYSAAPPSPVKK